MIEGPTLFAIASSERARIVEWSAGSFRTCRDLSVPRPPVGDAVACNSRPAWPES